MKTKTQPELTPEDRAWVAAELAEIREMLDRSAAHLERARLALGLPAEPAAEPAPEATGGKS